MLGEPDVARVLKVTSAMSFFLASTLAFVGSGSGTWPPGYSRSHTGPFGLGLGVMASTVSKVADALLSE